MQIGFIYGFFLIWVFLGFNNYFIGYFFKIKIVYTKQDYDNSRWELDIRGGEFIENCL